MCWSAGASVAFVTMGLCGTAYAARKKESQLLWIPLFYFTLMELLQAVTYSVINECSNPTNQVATLLGYLHISFQPFFANAVCLYFIDRNVRLKIQGWVYAACFVATIVTLIQLYPFDWAGACDPSRPLCGARLCSVSGSWHIAWEVPTNSIGNFFTRTEIFGISNGFVAYMAAVFIMPILYGSWRFTVYHMALGPVMASLLTSSANERPAVWCLLSIGLLLLVIVPKIRKLLTVKTWIFWPKSLLAAKNRTPT